MRSILLFSFLAFCFVGYGQIINFPDANFKNALVNSKCVDLDGNATGDADADLNDDGEIDKDEAFKVNNLTFLFTKFENTSGIEYFLNLEKLISRDNDLKFINFNSLVKLKFIQLWNQNLSVIDCSNLIQLEYLELSVCSISQLTLENCPNLKFLECDHNNLNSINVENLKKLETLSCTNNKLKKLDLSGLNLLNKITCFLNEIDSINVQNLPSLKNLSCGYNKLKYLNLKGIYNLTSLHCGFNNLSTLDVSKLSNLVILECENNKLTNLNLMDLSKITDIICNDNNLVTLNLKTGGKTTKLKLFGNSNLVYICYNDSDFAIVRNSIPFGQKIESNTYCSFTPNGTFFIIQGKNIYDLNNDGCDINDTKYPYIKYKIIIGNVSGSFISDYSGNYQIPIKPGSHTIFPIIENPSYFEVSPSSINITFPSTSDTITQDFCITPKGILRQTNITVIPLSPPARPGFDASYKIVWENVGNQIESGTLNFTYDETLLDYISATQIADLKSDGIVSWYFNNLLPFEKREITVTLKVNRPTDTPAVNAGDKLYLTASILDNIFTLENTVVGSYDPNDKTCLQGDRVKPDMVGEYVDYLIRFENTGNYAAENIVVKDIIDTKTFDVSTLKITDASHKVYTRIEGNKVEFIFENIQLPFDDANNDGYIAFKIKTLPTLVLGDSLKNLADIYFDYNFPIRTNEAQTTVALPVFTKDITTEVNIYPNPVNDILYLDTNKNWTKAEIYDIAGRILRSVSLDDQSIDVSELESGTYFIRLKDGEKVGLVKFVKI